MYIQYIQLWPLVHPPGKDKTMMKRITGFLCIAAALLAVVAIFTPFLTVVPYGYKIAFAAITLAAGGYCVATGKTEYRYDFQKQREAADAKYQKTRR